MKKRTRDRFESPYEDFRGYFTEGTVTDERGIEYPVYDLDGMFEYVTDRVSRFLSENLSSHIQTTSSGKQYVSGDVLTDMRQFVREVTQSERARVSGKYYGKN